MDGFLSQQMAAKDLFHDEDVFKDVLTFTSPWMARRPDHDVGTCSRDHITTISKLDSPVTLIGVWAWQLIAGFLGTLELHLS